jgi:hypothetical protein
VNKPVDIATSEGNEVAVLFEPENHETFMSILNTVGPATMANGGVIQETVKIFILDKEFQP